MPPGGLSCEMAYEILHYVTRRPRAQDTFDGILKWWLLEHWIERQRQGVRRAVEELLEAGLLISSRGRDDRERFRVDPGRLEEARELVAAWEQARGDAF